MFQKLFFGAAAAVTAFALVLLGGVLAQVGPVAASGNEAAVQDGSMPPAIYLPLHPSAQLTAAEQQQLVAGFMATFP